MRVRETLWRSLLKAKRIQLSWVSSFWGTTHLCLIQLNAKKCLMISLWHPKMTFWGLKLEVHLQLKVLKCLLKDALSCLLLQLAWFLSMVLNWMLKAPSDLSVLLWVSMAWVLLDHVRNVSNVCLNTRNSWSFRWYMPLPSMHNRNWPGFLDPWSCKHLHRSKSNNFMSWPTCLTSHGALHVFVFEPVVTDTRDQVQPQGHLLPVSVLILGIQNLRLPKVMQKRSQRSPAWWWPIPSVDMSTSHPCVARTSGISWCKNFCWCLPEF